MEEFSERINKEIFWYVLEISEFFGFDLEFFLFCQVSATGIGPRGKYWFVCNHSDEIKLIEEDVGKKSDTDSSDDEIPEKIVQSNVFFLNSNSNFSFLDQ